MNLNLNSQFLHVFTIAKLNVSDVKKSVIIILIVLIKDFAIYVYLLDTCQATARRKLSAFDVLELDIRLNHVKCRKDFPVRSVTESI